MEHESGLGVKILDDDDPPAVTLVLDPDSIDEDGGKSTVTASLDKPSIEDIEVTVSASPVAPAVASDFTLSDETVLTIGAGNTTSTGTVTITANDNDVGGGDQRVTVAGEAASDGDLTPPGDVTLTIVEDDPVATTVTLAVDRSTVAEDAAGSDRMVTVTAELDGVRAEATPVAVSVTGGTAVAGTDYAAVEGFTVTIAARMTSGSATFTLAPVDDEVDEPGETVVLTGTTTATGLTVAPADGVTVTITDNDPRPRATLVLTPSTIDEDGGVSNGDRDPRPPVERAHHGHGGPYEHNRDKLVRLPGERQQGADDRGGGHDQYRDSDVYGQRQRRLSTEFQACGGNGIGQQPPRGGATEQ